MGYSEKTQRELDRYTRKLVRSMPKWIKKLFSQEKVVFQIDESGSLGLCCVETLPLQERNRVGTAVFKYMDENPCKAFKVLEVQ